MKKYSFSLLLIGLFACSSLTHAAQYAIQVNPEVWPLDTRNLNLPSSFYTDSTKCTAIFDNYPDDNTLNTLYPILHLAGSSPYGSGSSAFRGLNNQTPSLCTNGLGSPSYYFGASSFYAGLSNGIWVQQWNDTNSGSVDPTDSHLYYEFKVSSGSATPILHADYSLPIDPSDFGTTTSLFDHDATSSQMTRYDGTVFYGNDADISYCVDAQGCYDGHHGIDFGTSAEGKNILAAASGTVETLGWENPSNHNQGYGYRMRIYHPQFDQSTIYGHATTTGSFFSVNDTVSRGDTILLSGTTGASSGPHLHFGVIIGDSADPNDAIDPFGWSAATTDPRTNDRGYLWKTNPPSL